MVAEDLPRAGVSTRWGTGSDVKGAGAPAAHLSDALVVSDHSDDCAEA